MTTPWHLDDALVERYRTGAVTPALAASLEQHVVTCAQCQALMAPTVPAEQAARMWSAILGRVDAPPTRPVERLLRRLGVDEPTARLLAAIPSLQLSWLGGIGLVLLLSMAAARAGGDRGLALYFALAPVLPVIGVAAAYAPRTDPLQEITAATPYSAFRLLMIRSLAVVAATMALEAVVAPFLPGDAWVAVAWLLPTLALTATTLALATRVDPIRAAGAMAVFWAALTLPGFAYGHEPVAVTQPAVQLVSIALVVLGAMVLRTGSVDSLPVPLRRSS